MNPQFTEETITRARFIAERLEEDTLQAGMLEGLGDPALRDAVLACIGQLHGDDGEGWLTTIHASAAIWPLAPANGATALPLADLAAGYMLASVLLWLEGAPDDAIRFAEIARRLHPAQGTLAELLTMAIVGGIPAAVFTSLVLERVDIGTDVPVAV